MSMQPGTIAVKATSPVREMPAPYGGHLGCSLAYMSGRHARRSGRDRNPYPGWTPQAEAWDAGYRSQQWDRP